MLRSLAAAAAARSPAAAALRRLIHRGSNGLGEVESVAYRMSMLRAPPVVSRWLVPRNSCSLIGRLTALVRPCTGSSYEDPFAYTFLNVSSSSGSSNFRVMLQLNGKLAKVSLMYLKPNDFVYVSGSLSSYHKADVSGKCIFYKINVTELNYVHHQNQKPQNDEDSADAVSLTSANTQILPENTYADRLRLWQVFFASPHEWWDNRQSKTYVGYPDFKHKDTREKLWVHPNDPPWVRKLLEMHDLKIAENGHNDGRLLHNHSWRAQDFE